MSDVVCWLSLCRYIQWKQINTNKNKQNILRDRVEIQKKNNNEIINAVWCVRQITCKSLHMFISIQTYTPVQVDVNKEKEFIV